MKLLIIAIIVVGAVGLLASQATANHVTSCHPKTSAWTNLMPNPDTLSLVASTTCDVNPQAIPPTADSMTLAVFWDWFRWAPQSQMGWKFGGLYDLAGCNNCTQTVSGLNTNVPHARYMGINCRRGQTIHMIWPHLETNRIYLMTTSRTLCR